MSLRYLADTSAVSRLTGRATGEVWLHAAADARISMCDPVELELLRGTPSRHRRRLQRLLRSTFPWCPVPDDAWNAALDLQDMLADASQHHGASVVDLLIAVTAMRHRLIVLHDDRDYETIARVAHLSTQRVVD